MTVAKHPARHTIAEWLLQPEERRLELIDGEFTEKAAPDERHSDAQSEVISELRTSFNRRGGGGHPGGWWIRAELDIVLDSNGYRPDVAGWRRDRVPVMPKERPITIRPDWICEVISQTLAVYRHHAEGYLNVLVAEKGDTVRAEPFQAIELRIGLLFGEDPDDPPGASST